MPSAAPLSITGTSPSSGTAGDAFSFTPSVTGGTPPYSFSLLGGAIPGLSLNTTTGELAGTLVEGTYAGRAIRVTDAAGNTADLALSTLTVAAAPASGLSAEILPSTDYRGAWTLQVTGDWPASTPQFTADIGAHPDFPIMPIDNAGYQTGPSKVVLTVTGPGYTRDGGNVVPTTYTRTIIASKPIRRTYPDSTTGNRVIDERDNGDGTRTVWLALSEPIFEGETVTASFEAGWRTGQPEALNVPVVNNSDRQRPIPIARWAMPQWMPVIGAPGQPNHTQRVDMIIASHFAQHFGALANQAVAANTNVDLDGVARGLTFDSGALENS